MPSDIALLRRLAAGRETDQDRAELAERVRAYLDAAPSGVTLDEAFGLAPAAGRSAWWRSQALETRDAALRTLATHYYPDRTGRAQAAGIRKALVAYASTGWRFDQGEAAPPSRHLGTEREALFDVMNARLPVPSAERIRRVLRSR